jgi:uncharacterized OB-fold protein
MTDQPPTQAYTPDPPLPLPQQNADNAPYWDAAAEGRLLLQRCSKSGQVWFYPRQISPATWDPADVEWFEASGKGVVHSFSIVHRASEPGYRPLTPFVVALIDLAEGARMMTNIIGPDALDVAIGDAVRCVFEARGDGVNVPQFIREEG